LLRGAGKREQENDLRSAGVGIPAGFYEVESDVNDSVIVGKLATYHDYEGLTQVASRINSQHTHDPVPTMETLEMRTDMNEPLAIGSGSVIIS
jgi:hypothetical protein